jgi:hypothetical protein
MRPLCELALDLLVDFDVSLKGLDLLDQFLVFEKQFFSLLGLVLEFSGQLMILEHGQPGLGVKLFFAQGEKIGLGLLDLVQHVFFQLVSGIFFFFLHVDLLLIALGAFLIELSFQFLVFTYQHVFFAVKLGHDLVGFEK